ncbi:MAG: hypothetical protein FIB02_08265 [Desulfuromonas sp.]|nr:hypothetical protein [Desulfuromonas sp.]
MVKAKRWWFVPILAVLLLGGCVIDPGVSGRVSVGGEHGSIDIAFNDHDRALIRDYYGGGAQRKGLPPGLAKKDKLPPGLQKQLVRRGQLPPGLQYQRFPADLERRLSPIPEGYLRAEIDGSFVLFNEKTRVIFDVFAD